MDMAGVQLPMSTADHSSKKKRTKLSSKSETSNLAIKYLKERNYSVSTTFNS